MVVGDAAAVDEVVGSAYSKISYLVIGQSGLIEIHAPPIISLLIRELTSSYQLVKCLQERKDRCLEDVHC